MRVPRATLRKILHDEICSHERFEPAMINWGKELTMYTQDPDTNLLSLTFKDGSVEDKVSLLIGADGVRSCVALLTPKPAPSSYFGIMLVLGISSFQHPLTTERGFYSIDGNSRLFLMPFEAAKTMWQLTFNFDYEKAMELRKAGPQVSAPPHTRIKGLRREQRSKLHQATRLERLGTRHKRFKTCYERLKTRHPPSTKRTQTDRSYFVHLACK